jgi:PhnB protein
MVSNAETQETQVVKDLANKKITITRYFEAEPELVWLTWTEPELLDQWWAPRPWQTETKTMNFKKGGHWLYSMVGPNNERHWARVDFEKIDPQKSFETTDYFVDEKGVKNTEFGETRWKIAFRAMGSGTEITVEITSASEANLQQLLAMGFETGFTMALGNLEQYLQAQFKIRKQLKTNTKPRVTTYLNFPGNTEEAFKFYRSVFGTEFSGEGIKRFGDIPPEAGHPPVPDPIKKMVLHVELPILGGHVLMATDAPKEMGMTLTQGNNMHICVEPSTRAETKKLFDALSSGGNVTMPLADMFFGAYFGEFTDRYGINWMFNCIEKP